MKNVDLMFCSLGNGVTVCDRFRQTCGDYWTVAHIDPCGAIRLYDEMLPDDAVKKINDFANRQARIFKNEFIRLDRAAALDMLNDLLNVFQFLIVFRDDGIAGKSMEEIYTAYIKYVCLNHKRTMPEQ